VLLRFRVFWAVTSCLLVCDFRRFEGSFFQKIFTFKIRSSRLFETSDITHHTPHITHCTSHTTHHTSYTTHHTPHITQHIPHITHHTSHTTHHKPRTTHHTPHITHYTSHTTHNTSHTTHHTSHNTHHTSHTTHHTSHNTNQTPHTQRHSVKFQKTRTLGSEQRFVASWWCRKRRRFRNRTSSPGSRPKASKYESGRGHWWSDSHRPGGRTQRNS
jgi:hypothetical protein